MTTHHHLDEARVKAKQVLGHITGDRHVEAEGVAEAQAGPHPDPEEVEAAEERVRRAYNDID